MNSDGTDQRPLASNAPGHYASVSDWQPALNNAPDCAGATASPGVLRSHNRRFVPVTLDGATDPDNDAIALSVDGVTQDEPVLSTRDRTYRTQGMWRRASS